MEAAGVDRLGVRDLGDHAVKAGSRAQRWLDRVLVTGAIIVIALCVYTIATDARASGAATQRVVIPDRALQYRMVLQHEVGQRWGIHADQVVARIAAQIHAESTWRAEAESPYAQGLAQFVPATAEWVGTVCKGVGPADPWNPHWSIRAAVCFDRWLWERATDAATDCDRWAFVLADYNGGRGWRLREQRLAEVNDLNPQVWFGQVETRRARSQAAWAENRGYVRRILITLEPAYVRAGWPGVVACHA